MNPATRELSVELEAAKSALRNAEVELADIEASLDESIPEAHLLRRRVASLHLGNAELAHMLSSAERVLAERARAGAMVRGFEWVACLLPKETAGDILGDYTETMMKGEMTSGAVLWFKVRTFYWLLCTSVGFVWNKYVMRRFPASK